MRIPNDPNPENQRKKGSTEFWNDWDKPRWGRKWRCPISQGGLDEVFAIGNPFGYNRRMATLNYLDRLLEPVTDAFTMDFARRIADLRIDDELQAEIDVLRRKANDGTLSPEQDAAYKDFVEALDVMSIILSKARQFLARCSS
jgi:hypothetical protein